LAILSDDASLQLPPTSDEKFNVALIFPRARRVRPVIVAKKPLSNAFYPIKKSLAIFVQRVVLGSPLNTIARHSIVTRLNTTILRKLIRVEMILDDVREPQRSRIVKPGVIERDVRNRAQARAWSRAF
jgi:hypothetical protein